MSYYNTTHIGGVELLKYTSIAKSQDEKILEFFEHHPGIEATSEDLQFLVLPRSPLTSVRRGLSNLHKDGHINKGPQVKGMYGRPIHTWSLS